MHLAWPGACCVNSLFEVEEVDWTCRLSEHPSRHGYTLAICV